MVLYCYSCSQLCNPPASSTELKCPLCDSEFVQILDDQQIIPFLPAFRHTAPSSTPASTSTSQTLINFSDEDDYEDFESSHTTADLSIDEESGDIHNSDSNVQSGEEARNYATMQDIFGFLRMLGASIPTDAAVNATNLGPIIIHQSSNTTDPAQVPFGILPSRRDFANFMNVIRSRQGTGAGAAGVFDFESLFGMHGDPGDYAMGTEDYDQIVQRLWEQAASEKTPGNPPMSEEQISALKRIPFVPEIGAEKTEAQDCSICKEVFKKDDQTITLSCNHRYHDECIAAWLKISGTCPVCRKVL